MGDLRGVKRNTWEGGHRVPFIASWPARIQPGSISTETVCHVDMIATCADLTRFQLPNEAAEDSVSIVPALLGEKRDHPLREATVHHGADGTLAIRKDHWVFINAKSTGGDEPDWFKKQRGYVPDAFPGQLYDLDQDPSERHNLYGQHPEIVKDLKALLAKYQQDGRSVPVRR